MCFVLTFLCDILVVIFFFKAKAAYGITTSYLRSDGFSFHSEPRLIFLLAQQLPNKLAERISAGVKLRLLADPGFASRSFSEVLDLLGVALPDRFCKLEAGNQPLTKPLKGIGTPRLARGDKLHHKFAVIDNKTVITGSFNWSPSAAHTNDETLLVIESPQLAAHFLREMDRMWRGAELGITARMQRKLDRQTRKCGRGIEKVEN